MGVIAHRVIKTTPVIWFCKLSICGFCTLAAMQAAEWHIETVPNITGGKFSSFKLDTFGNAHVVHMEGVDNVIRYSFWDRTLNKWFSTDLAKGSGFCSLTLDSKQHPHISYPAGSGVMHMYWDGDKWQKQFAEVHARKIDYYTSIALDSRDYPTISFYEEAGAGDNWGRLRVVSWRGSYWELNTVDPDHGSGKFNSMNSNSKGYPEIAYANVEYVNNNVGLRYAHWNGEAWETEVLERNNMSLWSVFMALDAKDIPHIVYTDVAKHLIKYATRHEGKWQIETVDSISKQAYPDRNGIALDADGTPYVSYYDGGAGILKLAHRVNGRWLSEIVDRDFVGYTSSIQIASITIFLSYGDELGQSLRFARRPLNPPAAAARRETVAKPQ